MREPAKALTDVRVKSAKTPQGVSQVDIPDGLLPGFYLRVSSRGGKSWQLFYRPKVGPDKGKQVRLRIGDAAAMSLADARQRARDYKEIIEAWGDPRRIEQDASASEDRRQRDTVKVVLADFIARYAKRNTKSWRETEATFERHVIPEWGETPVSDITRRDLLDLLDGLTAAGKPVTANRVLAHVRKAWNWMIERGLLETSPADRIKPPARERARDRVLTDEEIRDLWRSFGELGYPFGPWCKVLLLLGQRRDEVAGMRWADVDLEKNEWRLPRELTKSNRTHVVPLPEMVRGILSDLPRFTNREDLAVGVYVFTTTDGRTPISGYSKVKRRIEAVIAKLRTKEDRQPMPQWQFHDFRRTVGTRLTQMGISLDHVARVLNHAKAGVTGQVYDQYSYQGEKERALSAWSNQLAQIVRLVDETNVARLGEARA